MGVDGDEGVMGCATAQHTGAGVEGSQHLCALGREQTGVDGSVWEAVGGLPVTGLLGVIGIVADVEVPGHLLVFGGAGVVGGHRHVDVVALIITGFDEQGLVAGHG